MRELRPVLESVFTREHELGVSERDGVGFDGVREDRAQTLRSVAVASRECVQQVFGLCAELFERGTRRKTQCRVGHGDLLSMMPVSARRAERRSKLGRA